MAHTLDTSLSLSNQTGTSVSLSYTPGAGTTVLVVGISITTTAARTGGAPTFSGIALTQSGTTQISGSNAASTELWYLINPPTGAASNIVVPNTGGLSVTLLASSFKAAPGLTSILDTSAQATNAGNGSTNPTVTISPSVSGCAVVSVVMCSGGALTTGQTLLSTGSVGSDVFGSEYALPANGGAINMNWTNNTSTRWTTNAVAFREISTGFGTMMGCGA